jgi:hypothetical protein
MYFGYQEREQQKYRLKQSLLLPNWCQMRFELLIAYDRNKTSLVGCITNEMAANKSS